MDNDSRDSIIERIATVLAEVLTDAFERMRTDDHKALTPDGGTELPPIPGLPEDAIVAGPDMVHRLDDKPQIIAGPDMVQPPDDKPQIIAGPDMVQPPGEEGVIEHAILNLPDEPDLNAFVGPMQLAEVESLPVHEDGGGEAPPEPPQAPPASVLPEGVEPDGADVSDPDVKGIVVEPPPQFVGGDEPVMLFGSGPGPDMFVPTDEQPMPNIIADDPPAAPEAPEPVPPQKVEDPPSGEVLPPPPEAPIDPELPPVLPDDSEATVSESVEDGRYKVDDSVGEIAGLSKELGDKMIESNKQVSRLLMKMVESIEDNRKRIQQIESRLERDRGYWL